MCFVKGSRRDSGDVQEREEEVEGEEEVVVVEVGWEKDVE